MVLRSVLKNTALNSPLLGLSKIKPKGESWKRAFMASLLLTSLVDAFSILVLFLLSSYSTSGEILYISKGMELPVAVNSQALDRHTVVKVEGGIFYVEDKPTRSHELTARLLKLRQDSLALINSRDIEPALIIQADKKSKYELLSEIIHAGAQAGYSEIKFAVLAER